MNIEKELTAKEEAFCVAYTTIGSEIFSNGTKSAIMEENMVTTGSVLANLDHDRLMARKNHQYSVATRCTELRGKYLAMFTDNIADKTEQVPKPLTDEERAIYQEAAKKLTMLELERDRPTPEDRRQEIAKRNVG